MVQHRRTKGSGSIQQVGENTWRLRWEVPPENDKRKWESITIHGNRRQADKALREKVGDVENGRYVPKVKQTVGEYLQEWLDGTCATTLRQRTVWGYRSYVGRYAGSIAGKELQKLTSDDIQKLYSQLLSKGLSGATVLQFHRIISKALTVAVGKGKILSNPCAKGKVFPPAKEQHEMRVWDEDTLYTFFQEAKDSRFRDFYHLAVLTGMRRSEICALTWDNVDFNSRTLSVMGSIHRIKGLGMVIAPPKTRRSRRQIDLSDEVVDLLRTVRGQQVAMKAVLGNEWNSDNWVFANPEGGPTVPDQVTQEFARIIKKAALPHIRLHDLRHQCATLLFKRGVSAKVVSELLGHSSISITLDTYSHVLPGMQREAVSLLDGIVTRQNRH